ncbi:MAG TPA: hypothetical protein VMH92_08220 [Acidocella sp.]|nr:hypothetical protein [Acidocella sp.]
MEWLFCVSPNIIIGLASALGGLYFLLICAEETSTLLAYRRAMRASAEPLARHRRVKFPRFPLPLPPRQGATLRAHLGYTPLATGTSRAAF